MPPITSVSANGFVGRARELAELRAGLDEAVAGRGKLFLISGEPGIGKTWLADEAAAFAASRGMRVYWGRCFEDGGAPAYWPWVQALRRVIAEAGNHYWRTLPADIVRMLPELAAEAPQSEAGGAERLRFRLFDAVARLLRESASVKPVMLVLDDLHDADVASLELLRFVARVVHDAELILVGTYRIAEMRHSRERVAIIRDILRDATQIPLAGLAEDEVGCMVKVRAKRAPDPGFVAALCRTTAGNPLFVAGVVRVLAAEGRFASAEPIALTSYKLPDEVRAAIQRWLVLLSPDARALLTTAALVGLEFELKLLEKATATAPERVAELISSAQEMGIVSSVGKSLCRFCHPLLREALSGEPTTGKRAQLHRAIATALEDIQGADTESYISLLAHHWRESAQSPEEIDKAIDYALRAGDAAAKALALGEAVLRWNDALQLNKEHQPDLPQRAKILVRLGGALPGRGQQVLKNLEDALAIYEQLGMTTEAADVHRRLCMHLQHPLVDLPRAEKHFRRAEALLSQMPPNKSLAQLYVHWCGVCLYRAQTSEAFEFARRAVELAEELDSPSVRAQAGKAMGESFFAVGRLRECFEWTERAWEEADEMNDPGTAGGTTMNSCYFLTSLRDYQEALKRSRREMARPRNKQSGYYEAYGGINDQITHHSAMGELNQVRQLMSDLLKPADSRGTSLGKSWLMFWAGDLEGVGARWTADVDSFRSQQRLETLCQEVPFLAQIRRLAGHHDKAEEILRESLSYSVPGGYVPMEILGRQCLSQLCAETGRTEEARVNLARCREIMTAGEDWRGVAGLVSLSEAAIAAAEQRFDDADRLFADALQIIRRYTIRWIEGSALYDWGRALATAGQRDRALEKFDEAIELYRRVGAGEPWIDRAEAARAQVGSNKPDAAVLGRTSVDAQFRKEGDYRTVGDRSERWIERVETARLSSAGALRHEQVVAPSDAVFHREADYWTIAYQGRVIRLKDIKGMSYIAHLLGRPDEEFHSLDLVSGGETSKNQHPRAEAQAALEELAQGLGDAGEMLDSAAKASYLRSLKDLRAELDEAEQSNDSGRAEKIREEIDFIEGELARAIGLHGRGRRAASAAERARLSVTRAIKAALARIAEEDAALGYLLGTTIRTGNFCSYRPDARFRINWRL